MPTPKRGSRLGGGPSHQKQILANLASDLFRHGRIKTTEAKGRLLRPYAEKLITKGKRGDLHARRQVLSKLHDRDVVAYLFDDVAPRFADRNGGYTRMLKLGPRKGDHASMVLVELTELGESSGEEVIEDSKLGRSRGLFGRRRRAAATEPAAAGTTFVDDVDEDEDEVTDEDVAAAVAQVTGAAASDSPDSPDSPASDDSDDSAPSPDSASSPDSAPSADSADDDDADGDKSSKDA